MAHTHTHNKLSLSELEAMRDDLLADAADIAESLRWVNSEIGERHAEQEAEHEAELDRPRSRRLVAPQPSGKRGYTRLSAETVRDAIMRAGPDGITAIELAEHFGTHLVTVKRRGDELYHSGTVMKSKAYAKAPVTYHIVKPGANAPALKPKRNPRSRPKLRLVSGVPHTGKQNEKVRRRRGAVTGTGGQKR